MAYLNLFSLVALTVTESAALSTPNQPSLNTTAFAAYTPTHLPLNTSLNTNLSELLYPEGPPSCTHDPRWLLPGDLHGARRYQDACDAALLEMENVETISPTPHTFIAGTLSGHFQEPIVETPIRYTETGKTQFQIVKTNRLISHVILWQFMDILVRLLSRCCIVSVPPLQCYLEPHLDRSIMQSHPIGLMSMRLLRRCSRIVYSRITRVWDT